MLDFQEMMDNGLLTEWYAIPVLVLLVVLKVIFEKKYQDSIKKRKKD